MMRSVPKAPPATEYSKLSTAGAVSVGIPTQATLTFGFRRHRRRPNRSGRIEGLLSVLLHDAQQEIDSLLVIFDEVVHGLPVSGPRASAFARHSDISRRHPVLA